MADAWSDPACSQSFPQVKRVAVQILDIPVTDAEANIARAVRNHPFNDARGGV